MIYKTASRLLILGSLLTLPGCASKAPFPSLAPRAVERLSMDEPVRAAPVVARDADLGAVVDSLRAEALRGAREFEAALPAARARAAAAGGAGSESWIEAQQAVSRLEAARKLTLSALAELDRLAIERSTRPTNAAQFAELTAAVETARSAADTQQEQIDGLRARLSPA